VFPSRMSRASVSKGTGSVTNCAMLSVRVDTPALLKAESVWKTANQTGETWRVCLARTCETARSEASQ